VTWRRNKQETGDRKGQELFLLLHFPNTSPLRKAIDTILLIRTRAESTKCIRPHS
jgi:hypothetical protein